MSSLCSFFSPKSYHAELYIAPASNKSKLPEQAEIEWESNGESSRLPVPNREAIIEPSSPSIRRFQSASTLPELRASPSPSPPPNPENSALFSVVNSLEVSKGMLGGLLRNKGSLVEGKAVEGNLVVRMISKSGYENIAQAVPKGRKWEDKSFPPADTYHCGAQKFALAWPSLDHLAAKIVKAPLCFIDANSESADIIQGHTGDCYFLSAVAALTSRADRVRRLFPANDRLAEKGIYLARMMFKGILQEVVVDERFPVIEGREELLGCRPSSAHEIYAMVLEKCWAKLWKSYEAIDGGFPHTALHALTGALTKNYLLYDETLTAETNSSFFQQVLGFYDHGYLMCSGTGQNEWRPATIDHPQQGKIKIIIAPEHIYCVDKFYEEKGNKMVRLYNPWGHNTINGSQSVSQSIQGGFDLAWDQFLTSFKYLTVCKTRDNANYLYTELEDCRVNEFSFIELNVYEAKTGYFAITLSETDRKEKASSNPYLTVTYIVLKCSTEAKTGLETYELDSIRTEYKFSDHYLELSGMAEGKYVIAIYFSEVEVKEHLTFGVYSEDTFGIAEKSIGRKEHQSMVEQALLSYDRTVKAEDRVYPEGRDRDIWYSFNVMVGSSSFGYFLLHVGKNEKRYQISMGKKAFSELGLTLWEPYNVDKIGIIAEAGHESIALMTINGIDSYRHRDRIHFNSHKKHIHTQIDIGKGYC